MNEVTAIVVNWLTARRTEGAVLSIKKFYPSMPIIVVDDGSDAKDKGLFMGVYKDPSYRSNMIYDPNTDRLKNIPGTTFIQVPDHRRHGESIDFAMPHIAYNWNGFKMMPDTEPKIRVKWIFHIDSDVRLIKPGVIEKMLEGTNSQYCGIGIEKQQNPKYPKVSNSIMMFRNDLYQVYNLQFKPIYELGLEAGTRYYKFLTDNFSYKIKFLNSAIDDYYVHLRWEGDGNKHNWHTYY